MERFEFNTAISAMMELSNAIGEYLAQTTDNKQQTTGVAAEAYRTLLILLHPFAPHMTDELWESRGGKGILLGTPWPVADEALMAEDVITVVVQVNGKLRGQLAMPVAAAESEIVAAAKANEKVAPHLEGKTIVKTIYVPGKLVNLVVK
jgi:leucyl-tRNA synthetase